LEEATYKFEFTHRASQTANVTHNILLHERSRREICAKNKCPNNPGCMKFFLIDYAHMESDKCGQI